MNYEDTLGKIMYDEETIAKRVAELGAQISADYERDYPGEELLCITILKGGAVFASDLLRRLTVDARIDFMAVSSYGSSTKSSGVVRINKDLDTDIEGKNVLIVEDIIDSGLTLHYLIETLWYRGPKSIKICTFLNKPARRRVDLPVDYIGFDIENRFIVGYGLDYDGKYRNLPYITCLDE
jgi:hypoxanthine phosphoribosyltransferase